MASPMNSEDGKSTKKKTRIGNGKFSKFPAKGSNGTVGKLYRKKYRGQGKG